MGPVWLVQVEPLPPHHPALHLWVFFGSLFFAQSSANLLTGQEIWRFSLTVQKREDFREEGEESFGTCGHFVETFKRVKVEGQKDKVKKACEADWQRPGRPLACRPVEDRWVISITAANSSRTTAPSGRQTAWNASCSWWKQTVQQDTLRKVLVKKRNMAAKRGCKTDNVAGAIFSVINQSGASTFGHLNLHMTADALLFPKIVI